MSSFDQIARIYWAQNLFSRGIVEVCSNKSRGHGSPDDGILWNIPIAIGNSVSVTVVRMVGLSFTRIPSLIARRRERPER